MLYFNFYDNLYRQDIEVFVTNDYDTVAKNLQKKYRLGEVSLAHVKTMVNPSNSGAIIELKCELGETQVLWLEEYKPSNPEYISTLSHEITHLATNVFISRGISITTETNEPFAYYIGWLIGEILTNLRRLRKEEREQKKKAIQQVDGKKL